MMRLAFAVLTLQLTAQVAVAGGSNYGIAPGARAQVEGRISEWAVPTPQFARDPAPGPDGNIYIAVMFGNKIARFDTRAKTFTEWDLPPGARPHGLLVDRTGRVWYTGNGNGTIGELDPRTGKVVEHKAPSGGDPAAQKVGKEYTLPAGARGGPSAVTIDGAGAVWVNEIQTDTVVRLEPKTDALRVFTLPSRDVGIRKMIVDADGRLWYMGSHNGRLGVIE